MSNPEGCCESVGSMAWSSYRVHSPLDLAQTSGPNYHHRGIAIINDVEEHVTRVLRVPRLAGDGHVQACTLQKRCSLTNKDVGKALTLRAT